MGTSLVAERNPSDEVVRKDAAAEAQSILRTLGFYRGDVRGTWDEETEKAFREWAGYENIENKIRNDDKIWGSV
jgi:uncharacterized Ntn-hydrolase superfamily protein